MNETDKLCLRDQKISSFGQLLNIGTEALKIRPPFYIRSILGNPAEWIFTRNSSEFTAASIYKPVKTFNLAIDLLVPALPLQAPAPLPPLLKRLFWRPTRMMFNPDHNQNPNTFPEESWFFINGICTNEMIARQNASYLSELFHRPFQMVQNATDGAIVDLLECAVGKGLGVMTEPARKGYPAILAALKDPKKDRVVVICHSQGTIIMGNILQALKDPTFKGKLYAKGSQAGGEECIYEPDALDDPALLAKLEIYAFANCATNMTKVGGHNFPHIESYGNEFDIVARLGCLSPKKRELGIRIDGPTYQANGKWGHLLNVHYLFGMRDYLAGEKPNPYTSKDGNRLPRLYDYFQGGKPSLARNWLASLTVKKRVT
jgi:hypothetical protein